MEKTVAYFRTSSQSNVGENKDSLKRQQFACHSFGQENGLHIVSEFYDAGVKGKDLLQDRPGFSELLRFCEENGVKTILFETASRFSRELFVQELGWKQLTELGFNLVCADAPEYFSASCSDPSRKMIRQILGSVAEFQKDEMIAKLRGARKRKAEVNKKEGYVTLNGEGKCGGRISLNEQNPELVKLTKKLHRKNPKTGFRRSKRLIARLLFEQGYKTAGGNCFAPKQISKLLKG